MDQNKVDMFMLCNAKYLPEDKLPFIKEQLLKLDESNWSRIELMQFKNPTTILILSLFAGSMGIDRFMIGDTGMGIGKLLTCGGMGIWTIIDWFLIMDATREKNIQKLMQAFV